MCSGLGCDTDLSVERMRWIRYQPASRDSRISAARRQRKQSAGGKHAGYAGERPDQLTLGAAHEPSQYAPGYAGGKERQTWRSTISLS